MPFAQVFIPEIARDQHSGDTYQEEKMAQKPLIYLRVKLSVRFSRFAGGTPLGKKDGKKGIILILKPIY
jgi:hypothetical protein